MARNAHPNFSGLVGSRTRQCSLMKPSSVCDRARMPSTASAMRARSRSAALLARSARISASVGKRTEDLFKAVEIIV
ncbi:hypothetical protein G6F32_017545 [Rhizopus arrhizus]|nr:hypothetical protein G6F32_017545 [Rhizopus arrhizus]